MNAIKDALRGPILLVEIALVLAFLAAASLLLVVPELVLAASYAAAALLLLAGGVFALVERRVRLQRVLAAVAQRSSRGTEREAGTWRIGLLALMRVATRRVAVIKDRQVDETKRGLVSAGYRSHDAFVVYSFLKMAVPLAALAAASVWIALFDPIGRGLLLDVGAVAGAALVGSRLPDVVVKRKRRKRLDEIRKALPDTLDMLVICTEAGLGSDAAMKRVVSETGRRSSALGDELHQMALELTFMPDRRPAFENLAERVPLPAVQAFSNTMVQAEKYGTPLARAFKVLSQEQRAERMMRAEEKAGRLPATMTVPMMLFILPALFIVLMGPAVIDIMDNFIAAAP